MARDILIVCNETSALDALRNAIRASGMDADTAESGEYALNMLSRKSYALLIFDITVRGADGFSAIKKLRVFGNRIPIILINDTNNTYAALYGLNIGADDYITKPFDPVMFGAKIKALIRRSEGAIPCELVAGPFTYNTSTLRLYRNGQEITLTGRENSLMKLFLDNPDRVFSKDMLYEKVWNDAPVDDNTIMVYINRLRQKIEPDPSNPKYIRTVRGMGYRFVV